MKQLRCVICRTYKKMEKRKIYLLEKILVFSIISSKCKNENEKKKKLKKEWIEILEILGLYENISLL